MTIEVIRAADSRLAERLAAGVVELDLRLPSDASARLLAFINLLQRWNRTYNLTAIRDPNDMLIQHLLDSLAVLPALAWLNPAKSALVGRRLCVADVGSGAGLPGIPWAIAEPEWLITSIEAVEKKAAFQRQAKIELGLTNLDIEAQRVESVPGGMHDLVVSRAFASLADFVRLAGHLINRSGCLCAMKGVHSDAELAELPDGWRVDRIEDLFVPELDAQRHIVILRKN